MFVASSVSAKIGLIDKTEGGIMKNSIWFFLGISLLVLIVSYGCSENSAAEMNQAQQSMEKAKAACAEDLASSDWQDAMKVWEQGQEAVKAGKPAKNFFLRAKSRFEKTYGIAKSKGEILSREVRNTQISINSQFDKIKAALESGKIAPKTKAQIKAIASGLEADIAAIDNLLSQGNSAKASSLARDIQAKLRKADLMIRGKKP
jgi:hypothetical protein